MNINQYHTYIKNILIELISPDICKLVKKYYEPKFLVNNDILHDMSLVYCYFSEYGKQFDDDVFNQIDDWIDIDNYLSHFKSEICLELFNSYKQFNCNKDDWYVYRKVLLENLQSYFINNIINCDKINLVSEHKEISYKRIDKIIINGTIKGIDLFSYSSQLHNGGHKFKIDKILKNGSIQIKCLPVLNNFRRSIWKKEREDYEDG
jgi:hypothetical protein